MDDGRKQKQRARQLGPAADMQPTEPDALELATAGDEVGRVDTSTADAPPAPEPAAVPDPVVVPADGAAPTADEAAAEWPVTITVTNHSRIAIVEPITGALIAPACSRGVTVASPSHCRQVIANIKAILRTNQISAGEVIFAGIPTGV
ncbi:MAG: hypothetical protein RLZZ373_3207 [Pseudomonadota bacterium]|jgi:hypothetical protein